MLRYPAQLLFGADPKAAFRTSTDTGLPRLYLERHISPVDHRYWVQFTTVFGTAEDVFSTLTVDVVRRAVHEAPENIVTLVNVLTLHLESLVSDPHFSPVPTLSSGGFRALLASTAPAPSVDSRHRRLEALNACRVLSRVIPLLYETKPRDDPDALFPDLEVKALWTGERRRSTPAVVPERRDAGAARDADVSTEDPFILADGNESFVKDPLADDAPSAAEQSPAPCTGHVLLMTVFELLFYAGFTMPWTDELLSGAGPTTSRVHYTIWEAGIGSPEELAGTTAEHWQCRTEVLRLLLVLLGKPMYVDAAHLPDAKLHALDFVTQELERPMVLSFLCSLLNTMGNYRLGDSWLGADTSRSTYVSLCLQTAAVLLSHRCVAGSVSNQFLHYANKLYRPSDFEFVLRGARKMFQAAMTGSAQSFELGRTTSTFAKAPEEHVSDMLAVLWVMVRTNAGLGAYITQHRAWSIELMSWTLYVALANRTSPWALGQAQMAIFLLQDLSVQTSFATHLCLPGSMQEVGVPVRLLRRTGAHALDALIEGVYMLMTTSAGLLEPLYACLLMILYNTAPSWQHLSVHASARLEQLLGQLSAPGYLLSSDKHPRHLNLLLEALSRAVVYQHATNANLLYVLVRSADVFASLRSFTYEEALKAIAHKRQRAAGQSGMEAASGGMPAVRLSGKPLPAVSTDDGGASIGGEAGDGHDEVSHTSDAAPAPSTTRAEHATETVPSMPEELEQAHSAASDPPTGQRVPSPPADADAAAASSDQVAPEAQAVQQRDSGSEPDVSGHGSGLAAAASSALGAELSEDVLKAQPSSDSAGPVVTRDGPGEAAMGQERDGAARDPLGAEGPAAGAATEEHAASERAADAATARGIETTTETATDASPGAAAEVRMEASDVAVAASTTATPSQGFGEAENRPDGAGNAPQSGSAPPSPPAPVPVPKTAPPAPPKPTPAGAPMPAELAHLATTVGKHGFVPSAAWVATWRDKLALSDLERVVEHLVPLVQDVSAAPDVAQSLHAHERVLAFLESHSLADVLPSVPTPAGMAPFQWASLSEVWFQSYVWGLVYAVGVVPLGVWLDTDTRLFQVVFENPPASAAGAALEAVSVLAGRMVPWTWSNEPALPGSSAAAR